MKRTYFYPVAAICCALLLAGCTGSRASSRDTPAATPAASPAAAAPEATAGPPADTEKRPAEAELPTASPAAEDWEQQAVVLTDQIVNCCLQSFDESVGITALGEREIFQFISTISQYREEPGYPYAEAVTITEPDSRNPNLVAHIAEADAQNIAYQLFGVTDWSYAAPDCYDGSVPEYCFNLEAGLPVSPYSAQEAAAEITGNSVVVSFRLTDSDSFAYAAGDQRKDFGPYQAVYQIMSEKGQPFLRFQGISPAP